MDADLDLLLTAVYVTADDLLPEKPERQAKRHRRGGRHAVRRASDHGHTVRPAFLDGRAQASAPPVPEDPRPGRLLQAPPAAGGHAGVADAGVRQPEPGVLRRSAARRLHPGRVRQKPRDGQALGARATPPTTATAAATPASSGAFGCTHLRPRRHPQSRHGRLPQTRRARGRAGAAGPHAPRGRRDADRRQGLRRTGIRPGRQPTWTPRSSDPAARTSPARAHTSPRSASASSASSGAARAPSPSSATAPAPSQASESASCNACSPSPPPSPSTTNSAAPAAHSSTTRLTRGINHLGPREQPPAARYGGSHMYHQVPEVRWRTS